MARSTARPLAIPSAPCGQQFCTDCTLRRVTRVRCICSRSCIAGWAPASRNRKKTGTERTIRALLTPSASFDVALLVRFRGFRAANGAKGHRLGRDPQESGRCVSVAELRGRKVAILFERFFVRCLQGLGLAPQAMAFRRFGATGRAAAHLGGPRSLIYWNSATSKLAIRVGMRLGVAPVISAR
jgi:hypothetical protein